MSKKAKKKLIDWKAYLRPGREVGPYRGGNVTPAEADKFDAVRIKRGLTCNGMQSYLISKLPDVK
jgi:hypothetical protein